MAVTFSAGFSVAGVNTANTQTINLANTAATTKLFVVEVAVGIAVAPTNAPLFALVRATARGTQTTTQAGLQHDSNDPNSIGTMDSAWSVAPTFSTAAGNRLRVAGMSANAGNLVIWTFYDAPIEIPAASTAGLVLYNVNASGATTGTFAGHVSWYE